jgi:epoxyqueuosine reductase QueG
MKSGLDSERRQRKNWVTSLVVDLVEQSPQNSLGFEDGEPAWDKPLVGFSRGDDPLYRFFKQDIGHFYWLPEEVFNSIFKERPTAGDRLTVISWILPQTRKTKSDHRKQTTYPSERWGRSRQYGEDFNNFMRRHMAESLCQAGFSALAPMLVPTFKRENSIKYGYASSWSERHAAFVAGLGTFGLSDGLITPVGKAIRCGSVIAEIDIDPDPRSYQNPNEYCLFYYDGSCRKCADRCPAGAISELGHDKVKCCDYIRNITTPYSEREYAIKIDNCGLCQVKVPCESGIPSRAKQKQSQS